MSLFGFFPPVCDGDKSRQPWDNISESLASHSAKRAAEQEVLLPLDLPGWRLTFCSVQLSMCLEEFGFFLCDLQRGLHLKWLLSPRHHFSTGIDKFLAAKQEKSYKGHRLVTIILKSHALPQPFKVYVIQNLFELSGWYFLYVDPVWQLLLPHIFECKSTFLLSDQMCSPSNNYVAQRKKPIV